MKYPSPLINATIQKRYKRFLADITLETGEQITAHVPNTGSMTNCWGEGWHVLVSESNNPKRKLKYTLELTHNGDSYINVNTSLTNKVAKEALEVGAIKELAGYENIKPEAKIGESRLDFLLTEHNEKADCYVEVKNVTLNDDDIAIFPDAVTTRGQKHLQELIKLKKQGDRAVMLYIIGREDVTNFSPASTIDPKYADLLKEAYQAGVEVLAYQCTLSSEEITVSKGIPVCL